MGKRIVVAGSSNTDMILQSPRIPKPGETILGGQFTTAPGGKGANQAVGAARAGGQVTFVARVGDDAFGREAVEGFQKDGIDTSLVVVDPEQPSGVALIFVADDGENSIGVASGANAILSKQDIDQAKTAISNADTLLMQLESPIETIEYAAGLAQEVGTKVILNPAPAHTLPETLLAKVSIITPNETEAEILTGLPVNSQQQAELAADKLLELGIETVIITLGAKGALLATSSQKQLIPGFGVKAVDSTAAGDVFNGNLTVALAEGKSLEAAIVFANAAAAISVTRFGAQPSAPTREEIEAFLLKQQALV